MTATATWRPKQQPWMPADYNDNVIWAVRAVQEGVASAGQQRLMWEWLMYLSGCVGAGDLSYRPGEGGERDTAFAEGKRYVGLQVRKMLLPELTPAAIPREKQPNARSDPQYDAIDPAAKPERKPRKRPAGSGAAAKRKPAPRKRASPGRSSSPRKR